MEGERVWSIKAEIEVVFLQWLEDDKTLVLSDALGNIVSIEVSSADVFGEFGLFDVETENNKDSQ